jgi:enamine deaminase RidA (YjgF/YER057c/UK114 family)
MTDTYGAEARVRALGLQIPRSSMPLGTYIPACQYGGLLYLSGASPRGADEAVIRGRIGVTMSLQDGYAAARLCGLTLLANMRWAVSSLDNIAGILKVNGYVVASEDFEDHPKVIDGCTDLFVDVFGEAGKSARTALGVAHMPRGIPVEVEAIALVRAR